MADPAIADELAEDLGFDDEDAALLAALAGPMAERLDGVVDQFYDVIASNPRLRAVFADESQIDRQKQHLGGWLRGLFGGSYGPSYWRVGERIGRTHVTIGLDQRYMVSMMGVLRGGLSAQASRVAADLGWEPEQIARALSAVTKLLDLELAVMLGTYQEAFVRRARAGERLATIGQVAATIGHELRNPLAVIDSSLALLRRRCPDDPKIAKHLDRIHAQVKVSDAIITNLLAMVRDAPPARALVVLEEAIREAWDGVRNPRRTELGVELRVPRARLDPGHLRQLLINLFQNAVDAGAETVRVESRMAEGQLEIVVEDDGCGLPEGAEAWLFEPLATTRQRGSGLGLALCRRIVDKHGGTIAAERLPGGTRLRARFDTSGGRGAPS